MEQTLFLQTHNLKKSCKVDIVIAMLIRRKEENGKVGWYAPLFKLTRDGEDLMWDFIGFWITAGGPQNGLELEKFFFDLPTLTRLTCQYGFPFFILENRNTADRKNNFLFDHLTNGYVDYAGLKIENWHGENI